jgi:hypothetical protein
MGSQRWLEDEGFAGGRKDFKYSPSSFMESSAYLESAPSQEFTESELRGS